MSGTYRRAVVYTRDGHYGLGGNARKGAASAKRMDRRAKRREAATVSREALAQLEEDNAIAREEAIAERLDAERFDELHCPIDDGSRWHDEADYEFPYEPDYFSEPDDFDYGMSYSELFDVEDY